MMRVDKWESVWMPLVADVVCPVCGAKKGEKCRDIRFRTIERAIPVSKPHLRRLHIGYPPKCEGTGCKCQLPIRDQR